MDVFLGFTWWVELHDPIYIWNIESSSCNTRAKQYPFSSITVLIVGICPFLLLLSAMIAVDVDIDVVEEVGMVFDGVA